jgi:uncharacterized membrane protein
MWYCYANGQQYGPLELGILRTWVMQGRLKPSDLVWTAGMSQWTAVANVPALNPGGTYAAAASGASVLPPAPGGTNGQTPNGELTSQALGLLSGRWGLPIGFCLLFALITGVMQMLPYIGGIVSLILTGPFVFGEVMFFLTFGRRGQGDLGMLFVGFNRFGIALGAYLLTALFSFLWNLIVIIPAAVGFIVMSTSNGHVSPEEMLPFWIILATAGVCLGVWIQLRYSQVFFMIVDHSGMGPLEAIRASVRAMDGRKLKLFGLWLRFVGWSLLCLLTCGIGFLWLMPYMGISMARF